MKTTMNNRLGFTLVELLVVISIIGMLAALLMPAIQAARETARRAQCISNQRQVSFATQNYEMTRKAFPPLRAPLKPSSYPSWEFNPNYYIGMGGDHTELTWVAFILPFMEQSTAWAQINSGSVESALYELVIPVMQCRSSGISSGDNRISYVANAGPQNTYSSDVSEEYGNNVRVVRDAKMYTVFFDHFAYVGPWQDRNPNYRDNGLLCKTKMTVENIASMDGTSMTILLSENENADHWIWYYEGDGTPIASHFVIDFGIVPGGITIPNDIRPPLSAPGLEDMESLVGFCYPNDLSSITTGEVPTYVPLQYPVDNERSPLFINEGRDNLGASITYRSRTARPSSGHPGVVVTAFCDGSVRRLKDDMDRTLFVRLCRPGSGVIINPKDLDW